MLTLSSRHASLRLWSFIAETIRRQEALRGVLRTLHGKEATDCERFFYERVEFCNELRHEIARLEATWTRTAAPSRRRVFAPHAFLARPRDAIRRCFDAEYNALREYDDLLSQCLPAGVAEVLEKQREKTVATLEFVRGLHEADPASSRRGNAAPEENHPASDELERRSDADRLVAAL